MKLQEAFQKIANIDLTLYTLEGKCEDQVICDHWHNFLQSIPNLSPAYKELVHNQTPIIENNNLLLIARNEAEASALKKRLEDNFKNYCRKIGANNYTIVIEVRSMEADIEKFRKETILEDQQIALKTVQEQQKRDLSKVKDQSQQLMLGNNIPDEPIQMEEIQDEEHRVTVQGYVFAVAIRKLR